MAAGALALLCASACSKMQDARIHDVDMAGSNTGQPPDGLPSIESPTAKVRFLNAPRMERSFAQALSLEAAALCNELGQYSCVGQVHKISLLGTEPYALGADEPLRATGATTPLVAERVALSGCIARVDADLQAPESAVIFAGLAIDASGHLDPATPASQAAIDRLYTRVLQRHASTTERSHFVALYHDLEALAAPSTARDWAVMSCVAVLTSLESLFY